MSSKETNLSFSNRAWKTGFRFITFSPCLILVSIGIWPWEGRNTFLPFGDRGRFAPVTAAVGHEHSSLRSSGDGHRAPMTFSDTFYRAAHKKSTGDLIIETRFYPPLKNLGSPWSLRSSHGRGALTINRICRKIFYLRLENFKKFEESLVAALQSRPP